MCEVAEQVIQQSIQTLVESDKSGEWSNLLIEKVDINSDAELIEQYSWHIPVLKRCSDNAELRWPFPPSRCRIFLSSNQ